MFYLNKLKKKYFIIISSDGKQETQPGSKPMDICNVERVEEGVERVEIFGRIRQKK